MNGMRHSCDWMILVRCIHAKVVNRRHGHSSFGVVFDTQSHVPPTMQNFVPDRLAAPISNEILGSQSLTTARAPCASLGLNERTFLFHLPGLILNEVSTTLSRGREGTSSKLSR